MSETVVHRALTSQLGLSPGTPFYNQLKNLALDTHEADVHPSHQQNMLNLDADDVDVAKYDKGMQALRSRFGGQVAQKPTLIWSLVQALLYSIRSLCGDSNLRTSSRQVET